jgi:hypothetical protein
MARSYTKECFKAKDQFKADHYNREADGVSQQFNGQLDQNNMPIASVVAANLVDPVRTVNAFGVNTVSTYMPTQSYHVATWTVANDENTVAEAMPTPAGVVYSTNYKTDDWNPYWNSFDYTVVTEGARIRFNAKEGMLLGGVTVGIETREGVITHVGGGGPNFTVNVGFEATCELAIFCNGVMVGRTGKIQPGAYILDIPFSTPIGNEFCEIVVKWQRDHRENVPGTAEGTYNQVDVDHHEKFVVTGISTWCRNQYR